MDGQPARGWLTETLLSDSVNLILSGVVVVYAILVARGGVAFRTGSISQQVGTVLLFSLLCGLGAFGTIEILKRLTPIRGLYQRRQLLLWLDVRTDGMGSEAMAELLNAMGLRRPTSTSQPTIKAAELRVFNLPTEQLAAQVGAAADVALAAPTDEAAAHRWLIAGLSNVPPQFDPATGEKEESPGDIRRSQRVEVGVDQLQISLGERWRRYVQGAALWISGAFGIGLIHATNQGAARYVLAAWLVGGLFAWAARDLAAVIERLRR